jgi:hypothetical protein
VLDPKTPAPDQASSSPPTAKPEGGEWRVETAHGRSLRAPDLATLHRWIIERRVTRDDRISQDGGAWQRVGDVADLVPFFDIVDSAERARRADTPGPLRLPAPPPYNSHPPAAVGPVVLDRGAFPEVEDRTETKLVRSSPSRWPLPLKLVVTTLVAALAAYAGIALLNLRRPGPTVPQAPGTAEALVVQAAPFAESTPPTEESAAVPAIEPLAAEPEAPEAPEAEAEAEEDEPAARPSTRKRTRSAAKAPAARAHKSARAAPASAAPSSAASAAMAAQGYADLGRRQFDTAILHFKQALAGSPSNGTALIGLAEAYRETGQKALALKAYRRYIQILPSGPDAGSARLQIRLLEGKK